MSTFRGLRIPMPCVRCGQIQYLDPETDLCRACRAGIPQDPVPLTGSLPAAPEPPVELRPGRAPQDSRPAATRSEQVRPGAEPIAEGGSAGPEHPVPHAVRPRPAESADDRRAAS